MGAAKPGDGLPSGEDIIVCGSLDEVFAFWETKRGVVCRACDFRWRNTTTGDFIMCAIL